MSHGRSSENRIGVTQAKVLSCSILIAMSCILFPVTSFGQSAGNRVGGDAKASLVHDIKPTTMSDPRFIIVDGSAEVRIQPTEIRMVMGAIAEAGSAAECKKAAADLVAKVRRQWVDLGIDNNDIVEDFIGILPVYKFQQQQWNDISALVETLDKYRFQTNLHVRLKDEAQAKQAMDVAFEHNVTDIISFDYWSPELQESKTAALKKAIGIAREKADIWFDAELFDERPKLVNLTENYSVVFPKQMYESYKNTIQQRVSATYNWKRDVPRISAARPETTFYRGPVLTGDALSSELPMRPEISVIAKIRLYYRSPFRDKDSAD